MRDAVEEHRAKSPELFAQETLLGNAHFVRNNFSEERKGSTQKEYSSQEGVVHQAGGLYADSGPNKIAEKLSARRS